MAASILVTGAAGFIGQATAHRLLARGETVIGIDNLNDYYEPALKRARLASLQDIPGFSFPAMDVADAGAVATLLRENGVDRVVHLAAQAGVRHSIDHPFAYEHSNIGGHLAVLEACRHQSGFVHLVY
ncbi:MAG: NAD-dependent epimerase/dehydratase family protein, partial [Sphingomonas parapaucimobilis]